MLNFIHPSQSVCVPSVGLRLRSGLAMTTGGGNLRKRRAEVTKNTLLTGRVPEKMLNFINSDLLLKLCVFWIYVVVKQKEFRCVYL